MADADHTTAVVYKQVHVPLCTVRAGKRKRPNPEQRKVYCEVTQGDEVARALKGPSSLKGFGRTFLKGR